MELIFATHNQHKAIEIQALMPAGIKIKTLTELNCHERIEESADTLQGNAFIKANYVFEKYGLPCFADDTGLEVEVLNMQPGVYSARYAGEVKNDQANMQKLLQELGQSDNRKAQFRTVICLMNQAGIHFFEGKVEGSIRHDLSGHHGFGYDPIFEPENLGKTFGEMNLEEKNKYSHRKRAFQQLIDYYKPEFG